MKKKGLSFWKRSLEFFEKRKFLASMIVAIIVVFAINFADVSNRLDEGGGEMANVYKIIYLLTSVLFAGMLALMLRKVKNKDNNYAKLFVVFAIIMGLIFLCLSPLFTGSDEHNHYYRIYEITNGTIRTPTTYESVGSELPTSLSEIFKIGGADNQAVKYHHDMAMAAVPLDRDDTTLYNIDDYATYYANTALYSPISYIPQAIGFSVGKVFELPPFWIGMLGRLFNLLCYVLIGYFAIKMLPEGKLFYLILLLSPNMLQCATTLSADAFMNVVVLLLLAVILNIRLNRKVINRWQEVGILLLSVAVSLCKICYMPFVFLVLLIKKDQYKKDKIEKYLFVMAVLVISVACCLVWMKSTEPIFDVAYPNSELQKAFILSHPFGYLIILLRSIMISFVSSTECLFVGTKMYHSQLMVPAIISMFYVGIAVVALLKKERGVEELLKVEKTIILGICAAVAILILTALYIQCTAQFYKVANPVIMGIQGRYFIPIVFCLPFMIKSKVRVALNEKKMIGAALGISLIVWFYMMNQFII